MLKKIEIYLTGGEKKFAQKIIKKSHNRLMAMALGVPTVGIFGSRFDKFWSYYKDNFKKIVSKNIANISAEQVIKEIEKFNVLT